jgi:hypothetical protein
MDILIIRPYDPPKWPTPVKRCLNAFCSTTPAWFIDVPGEIAEYACTNHVVDWVSGLIWGYEKQNEKKQLRIYR